MHRNRTVERPPGESVGLVRHRRAVPGFRGTGRLIPVPFSTRVWLACGMTELRKGFPGPRGRDWGSSTIYGNWCRGTGILEQRAPCRPSRLEPPTLHKGSHNGRCQARLNPECDWIVEEVPDLRIVSQEVWDAVKKRQNAIRRNATSSRARGMRTERARRPAYLFSDLLRGGQCDDSYCMLSCVNDGFTNWKTRGTCHNGFTIKRTDMEKTSLSGLKDKLMGSVLVRENVRAQHHSLNEHLSAEEPRRDGLRKELSRIDKELDALIAAVKVALCRIHHSLSSNASRGANGRSSRTLLPRLPRRCHPSGCTPTLPRSTKRRSRT